MRNVERSVQRGTRCHLHAMVRPQHLRTVARGDRFERLLAGMRGGKRRMAARMPILCQHDVAEFCGQPVDDRHHVVTARHGERAAGAKVVLYIDDDEDAVIAKHRGQIVSHDFRLMILALAQRLSRRPFNSCGGRPLRRVSSALPRPRHDRSCRCRGAARAPANTQGCASRVAVLARLRVKLPGARRPS